MKLSRVKEILKAELLTKGDPVDKEITSGGAADLMQDILAKSADGALLITGVVSEEVIKTAIAAHVAAILFVRGKKLPDELLACADRAGVAVLRTRYSMFVASGMLYINGLKGLDGTW